MLRNVTVVAGLLVAGSLLSSCSSPSTPTDTSASTSPSPISPAPTTGTSTTGSSKTPPVTVSTGSLKDPKSSIAYQLSLINAGDADKLKTCLTPRQRDKITKELVEKAKGEAGKYTIDDLYASAEMGQDGGKKTAKVKMKNGRTLTTLIQTNGQWLADTIWFN